MPLMRKSSINLMKLNICVKYSEMCENMAICVKNLLLLNICVKILLLLNICVKYAQCVKI
jgi:hypothetical protein